MTELTESHTHRKPTPIERGSWATFGIAAAIWVIASIVFLNEQTRYDGTPEPAAGWMTLAAGVAGVTLIPAILLTGIRQLAESLRGVLAGGVREGE